VSEDRAGGVGGAISRNHEERHPSGRSVKKDELKITKL